MEKRNNRIRQSMSSLSKLPKGVEQKTIEKYKNKSIREIQTGRKQCVDELNFEEADQIDKYLIKISKEDHSSYLNDLKDIIKNQMDQIFVLYDEKIKEIRDSAAEKSLKIKAQINNNFQQMKEKHINQLTKIIVERELNIEKVKQRKVAKAIELERQAKIAATNHKIPEALLLRNQSQKAKDIGIRTQLQEVQRHYDKILHQTSNKQKAELEFLSQTLISSIQTIESQQKSEERIIQKKVVMAIKNLLSHTTSEATITLRGSMTKSLICSNLEEFIEQKLWDDDRANLFLNRD